MLDDKLKKSCKLSETFVDYFGRFLFFCQNQKDSGPSISLFLSRILVLSVTSFSRLIDRLVNVEFNENFRRKLPFAGANEANEVGRPGGCCKAEVRDSAIRDFAAIHPLANHLDVFKPPPPPAPCAKPSYPLARILREFPRLISPALPREKESEREEALT